MKIKIIALITTAMLASGGSYILYKKKKYDEDGYNKSGYDPEGYDRDGYDKNGYNREGFDREGFNEKGFNIKGFNREGYDRTGFDENGYNKYNRDRRGYDRDGIDKDGFYKDGFNKENIDKSGYSRDYYLKKCDAIKSKLKKASEQMHKKEYDYAMLEIRKGLENGIICIIRHTKGDKFIKDKLASNIETCKDIFEDEFIDNLYGAKNQCNTSLHYNKAQKEYCQVNFSYKILEELLEKIEGIVSPKNRLNQ